MRVLRQSVIYLTGCSWVQNAGYPLCYFASGSKSSEAELIQ